MLLSEKLVLSARPRMVTIFREGGMVRIYNQSLLRWHSIGQLLDITMNHPLCLQGALCYSGGMQETSWRARYYLDGCIMQGNDARVECWVETSWGYEGKMIGKEPSWERFCLMYRQPTHQFLCGRLIF